MRSRDGTEEKHRLGGGRVSRKATPNIDHKEEKSKGNGGRFLRKGGTLLKRLTGPAYVSQAIRKEMGLITPLFSHLWDI
jgi:hypothetical protein